MGHIGFGLGAYSFRKTLPLWLVLVAAQIPDWLDAGFCVAGVGRGPFGLYTHGFVPIAIAAVAAGALTFAMTRDATGVLVVVIVVASHWFLDYFTGMKPTWPGGPVLGMSLYAHPAVDMLVETATILVGWLLYRRTLPASVRNNRWTYATLFALCALQVAGSIAFALNMGGHAKC
ncbi:MAG: hypothetical protein ABI026_00015 [Gemmatimonadaceae bacterium]